MKRGLLQVAALFWSTISLMAQSIDFESLPRSTVISNQYLSVGVRMHSMRVSQTGYGGVDSAHSGTKSTMPDSTNSIDGVTATSIANAHGFTEYPGWPAMVGDVVFVVPDTDIPATVNTFSLWMGFDYLNLGSWERNVFIIEGFNLHGQRVLDYISPQLRTSTPLVVRFTDQAIHRLRITSVDGLALDDFSFTRNPGSLIYRFCAPDGRRRETISWACMPTGFLHAVEYRTSLVAGAWCLVPPTNQWPIRAPAWTNTQFLDSTRLYFRVKSRK